MKENSDFTLIFQVRNRRLSLRFSFDNVGSFQVSGDLNEVTPEAVAVMQVLKRFHVY